MAKKRNQETEESGRRSRKEVLRERRLAEQRRQVAIGVGIVIGLLVLVFVFAIVNEFVLAPNRAVAVVQDEEISLGEWQDRVRLERAQRIVLLENQLAAFGGDVGIIQQFAGQAIVDLINPEDLGQTVLNTMTQELVARQQAQARGIEVTEAEIDAAIGEAYAYYDGESPTPQPTATQTVVPTPSVTPIPTAVITDVLPTMTPFPTFTPGPTSTPRPLPTPVSEESFNEQFGEFMDRLVGLGTTEEAYREQVEAQLYLEKLQEALAEENEVSEEAEHASFYLLSYETEAAANEAMAIIESEGFLTAWNTVRSQALNVGVVEEGERGRADEVLWRTETALESLYPDDVVAAAFDLPLNTPSDILVEQVDAEEEANLYHIVMVSGREERPLSASELQALKQQNLTAFLADAQVGVVDITGYAQGRAPTSPVLDPIFTQPPTATPEQPAATLPAPVESDE